VHPPFLRVLVVEDQPEAQKALCFLLKTWGHAALGVANGPEAVEAAERFRPDVALVDIILPTMSGYEVARQLRLLPAPPVWVVAMTGHFEPDVARAALEVGFDHFFVKPIERPVLEALLRSYTQARARAGRPAD
jgi:CheY-like chemotaxis protein